MSKIVLIDGLNFGNRAYYQATNSPALDMASVELDGETVRTGALTVCLKMIQSVRKIYPDAFMILCWDAGRGGRVEASGGTYKSNREGSGKEHLYYQLDIFKEFMISSGVASAIAYGYEADDVIACFIEKLKSDVEAVIYSTDKDFYQLLGRPKTTVHRPVPGKKDDKLVTLDNLEEEFGCTCEHVLLTKVLVGDPSDKIAGIPSTGKKKIDMKPAYAKSLAKQFSTVDELYEALDGNTIEATDIQKKALEEFREQAKINEDLVSFRRGVTIDYVEPQIDMKKVQDLAHRYKMGKTTVNMEKWAAIFS